MQACRPRACVLEPSTCLAPHVVHCGPCALAQHPPARPAHAFECASPFLSVSSWWSASRALPTPPVQPALLQGAGGQHGGRVSTAHVHWCRCGSAVGPGGGMPAGDAASRAPVPGERVLRCFPACSATISLHCHVLLSPYPTGLSVHLSACPAVQSPDQAHPVACPSIHLPSCLSVAHHPSGHPCPRIH